MKITEYTTFADVRSILGVEDDELRDETLELRTYSHALSEALHEVSPNLVELYRELQEKEPEERSSIEGRVVALTQLFASYAVALEASAALPMFSPRSIGDGKGSITRFSNDPYKDTIERIEQRFHLYRDRLRETLEELAEESQERVLPTFFRSASPAYDPVTGE